MQRQEKGKETLRRRFFHLCISAMGALTAGTVLYPIFSFFGLPKRFGEAKPVEIPLASLSKDTARYFFRQGIQIAVIFTGSKPKVFDAACTHLGCITAWDPNQRVFKCPCHGAVFNENGVPIAGPANKPLRRIAFTIKNEKLVIM